MSTSAVSSDSRNLGPQPPGMNSPAREHVVYFYQKSESLLKALCDLVGPALGAGNVVVIIASKVHRDGLQQLLRERGVNTQVSSKQGRYVELDASETLSKIMKSGMPDEARFAETVGGVIEQRLAPGNGARPEILIFGEMVSLLWTEGKIEAAIRLEQLWNELSKKHRFALRCAYPTANFQSESNPQTIISICAEHSEVLQEQGDSWFSGDDSKIALRRSEERFRWLVESVEDYAIFMLDVKGHVSSWNTGAERIQGYGVSEIIGKHLSIFYTEEDIGSGKPQRELEIAAKEGRIEDQGWRLRKDGSRFWANVIISAIIDERGKLVGYGNVTRDITERVTTNELLRKEIAERTEAQRKLYDSEKSLRQLSLRLLQTQEEERRRIGRDLHDSVGQYLVGLKMKLDSFKSLVERGQHANASQLGECSQLTEEAIKEVRTISYLLYPPMLEELGLKSAIPWYLEGFTKRSGIAATIEVSREFNRLPGDLELALFRVLQECLTNVHRHANSPTANVRLLTKDRTAILQITDAGKGIQIKNWEGPAQDGMRTFGVGLRGMSERLRQLGGSLELTSSSGGTIVTATIPLREAEPVE
ncbi:MAG: hypothetical protein PVS2B2_13210 [Candidatus Acidiferrum sp.]